MHTQATAPARAPVKPTPRKGPRRRQGWPLAALPDPREQDQLGAAAEQRARETLAAAHAAGEPLLDHTGRQRSPITLPEYRLGRAPANKGRRFPVEVLTPREVQAILDALPNGAAGLRNRALIIVLWRAGLRVAEALSLLAKDVDLEHGAVNVLAGKGAKQRIAAIDPGARPYIEAWLAARTRIGVGPDAPLFCTVHQGNAGGRLNPSTVREMLKRYARKASVPKRVHPHGLRHTHAFELSQEDIPVRLIQAQLGHEDLAMTARYIDHLSPKQLLDRIGARAWPGEPPRPPVTPAARSAGAPVPTTVFHEASIDPPEPPPAPDRDRRAPYGQGLQRVLHAIAGNGGSATQAQLRRALGIGTTPLLEHLHRLHEQELIIRAGFDRHRSVIWKIAPPRVVIRRHGDHLRAPPGHGLQRVLDAIDALGGRASQAQIARTLGLSPNTVHDHCLALAAGGQLERGGLDKSTSRRGSQIWRVPPPRPHYRPGGYSLRLPVPAR